MLAHRQLIRRDAWIQTQYKVRIDLQGGGGWLGEKQSQEKQ